MFFFHRFLLISCTVCLKTTYNLLWTGKSVRELSVSSFIWSCVSTSEQISFASHCLKQRLCIPRLSAFISKFDAFLLHIRHLWNVRQATTCLEYIDIKDFDCAWAWHPTKSTQYPFRWRNKTHSFKLFLFSSVHNFR
jgi:hypothetical protein